MFDKRVALEIGYQIKHMGKTYSISSYIGRGANCLVYKATFEDSVGSEHSIIMKELYPVYLKLKRCNNEIEPFGGNEEEFENAKERFKDVFKINNGIRNQSELTNSTSNVTELISENNTLYATVEYVEGENYEEYKDKSVKDVLKHVKALSIVIQKYHNHKEGYLHLDIKPSNIFVLPETAELVILFDFDSVVSINDLKEKRIHALSYSEAFSAPEQRRGEIERIGTHTDIYSIGALLFYKLFGRKPTLKDAALGARLPMEDFQFESERLPSKFERRLADFLGKTLTISPYVRLNDLEDVIKLLGELIKLADTNSVSVRSEKVESKAPFCGRSSELHQLHLGLNEYKNVFLSGIGGIGKTELARKYAQSYEEEYYTIVFLHYENSMKDMIASDALEIENLEFDDEELDKRYDIKFEKLKKLSERDLIIIDDFCAESDEQREELFYIIKKLKCKFIITTREVSIYPDCGYEQIDVNCMESHDDIMNLFRAYNKKNYSSEDMHYIEQMISLVDNHTMMIVLLAKYLRKYSGRLESLVELFHQKEGIAATRNNVIIAEQKDNRLERNSIMGHLRALFDISCLSEIEKEALMALSLFGPVRIQEDYLFGIINNDTYKDAIDELIEKGWVEQSGDDKISLHQLILDLIYNDLKPNTDNCKEFIKCLIPYFKREEDDLYLKRAKKKLAYNLLERIEGEDDILAELYYEYCRNINYDPELLDRTEKICSDSLSADTKLLLARIEVLRLEHLDIEVDILDEYELIDEEKVYGLYVELVEKLRITFEYLRRYMVLRYSLKALNEKNNFTVTNVRELFCDLIEKGYPLSSYLSDSTGEILYQTAMAVLDYTNCICEYYCVEETGFEKGFVIFYNAAESILLFIYSAVQSHPDHFSYEWKEKLLEQLCDLYDTANSDRITQNACLDYPEQLVFFSEKLLELHNDVNKKERKDQPISYLDMAEDALYWYEYLKAIKLFELAKNNDEPLDEIYNGLSQAYMEIGQYDLAEQTLLDLLKYDMESGQNPCFTYYRLEEVYERSHNLPKALEICEKIIKTQEVNKECGESLESLVIYCHKMKKLKSNGQICLGEKEFFEIKESIKKLIAGKYLHKKMVEVFDTYYQNAYVFDNLKEAYELLHQAAKKYCLQQDESEAYAIYKKLIDDDNLKQDYNNLYVQILVEDSEMLIYGKDPYFDAAYHWLCEAGELIDLDSDDDLYWFSKSAFLKLVIVKQLALDDLPLDLKKMLPKSNFYLMAERDIQKKCNMKDEFETWNDITHLYIWLQNNEMVEKCLMKLQTSLENNCSHNQMYVNRYCETVLSWYKAAPNEEKMSIIHDLFDFFLAFTCKHSLHTNSQSNLLSLFALRTMENQDYDFAILFSLMAVAAILDEAVYNDLKDNGFCYLGQRNEYEKILDLLLQDGVKRGEIDRCVSIMDPLINGLKNESCYETVTEKLKLFKSQYEKIQIEFKH